MKTTIAILLAGAMSAGAVTITFNQDDASVLDFNIDWGSPIVESSARAAGPGGSTVWWLAQTSPNPNFYLVEIHKGLPLINHFTLSFWTDPEYSGPVPTAYGSPNITIGAVSYPLDYTPYGARFIYTVTPAVPDGGGTWLMLAAGIVGLCAFRRGTVHLAEQ